MIITLAEIPDGGLNLETTISGSEFELSKMDGTLEADVTFKGSIDKFSTGCIVSGRYQSAWQLPCARCLESFSLPIYEEFRIFLTLDGAIDDEDGIHDTGENDLDISELISDEIHLIEILREQLILQIPMKPICSDSCRGLCSQCGNNLNSEECNCDTTSVDPRLMKLKGLKDLMDKRG